MMEKVGFTDVFLANDKGYSFTIFAPSDEAFARIGLKPDDDTPLELLIKAVHGVLLTTSDLFLFYSSIFFIRLGH